MATKAIERPGVSRYDVQPKKITTDEALNEVSPDSPRAAFSFLPADLERLRARRAELGYDDRERAQKASREAELKLAKTKLAAEQARVDQLEAQVKADDKASGKASTSDDDSSDNAKTADKAGAGTAAGTATDKAKPDK